MNEPSEWDKLQARRRVDHLGLQILQSMPPAQEVADGHTVEDVTRLVKNRVWDRGGVDELRAVEDGNIEGLE